MFLSELGYIRDKPNGVGTMPSSGHSQTFFAFYFESKTLMLVSVPFLVTPEMNTALVTQKLNTNRLSSQSIIAGLRVGI